MKTSIDMRLVSRRQATAALLTIAAAPLAAQPAWPSRPLKLIVGFAPGGGSDFVARALTQELAGELKQPVVVDNRPGAGGAIATRAAAASEPDGYTLLLGSAANFVINPNLMRNLGYDPIADFVPVGAVARFTYVLLARRDLVDGNLADIVAHAKRKDGELTIGSAGNGSNTHLVAAALQRAAGIRLRHIPYKGTTPALADLMGGNIDLLFDSVPTVLGQVRGGSLRAVATTGSKREAVLPNVPTLSESGYPAFSASNWFAVFAPSKTPPAVVARLNAAMNRALASDRLKSQYIDSGNVPLPGSSEDLGRLVAEETTAYKRLIQASGISIE